MTTTCRQFMLFYLQLLLLLLSLSVSPLLGVIINDVAPPTRNIRTPKLRPRPHFEAIYQFGDSLSDTGNLIREGPAGKTYTKPPYGESLVQGPTGRCSNGLIMVDYFAIYFGLPLLNPYLATGSDFSHGVNFAVAGASALDSAALAARNISSRTTNSSLRKQLDWFKAHLKSIHSTSKERREKLRKSLVLMGEIGGNDFNFLFMQGRTMQAAFDLVPDVVQTIKDAVEEVIKMGAVNVVVPGNFPIGCVPIYLVKFQRHASSVYDKYGCLKEYNQFAMFFNARLRDAIFELRYAHPDVAVVYGDYYSALRWVVRFSTKLGFERGGWHKACCAIGNNPYNYSLNRGCGSPGVPVCHDPTKRLSWDGIHMTQQGNKLVAKYLLRTFVPQLNTSILS